MRERAFCAYCGCVVAVGSRACRNHTDLAEQERRQFSTQSTGLSTPQAAPRREAIAPQIGADPA